MSLNKKYLYYLSEYPLLTKSATAGTFAALNEILASVIARDFRKTTIQICGEKREVRHVLSPKILSMVVYGSMIATPISHQLYKILNRVFRGKLSAPMKVLQVLASLCTISPILSAAYVSWLSLINGYRPESRNLRQELLRMAHVVRSGLKKGFWAIYKSSAQTSVVAITVAQNFLPPTLWVSFFTLVYFVVGTVQNTRFKLKQREQEQSQKKD
ncbi:putative peroxisomal membrane protein [Clavispora lusitaniae]|uniref:Peroxisomal membrane protein n=2 Tax=Clavispora lusitaniae TaxID=36911 RepID=C4XY66_CLAL4|nr:uncharacterized protein CLUG_00889 [Clavispora lusitaniae ATCC 42720]KAF7584764.1 Mpv17 / PMP22 family protein [Clavispora lusitaniae]EEQ36766.1 hypothetical protein CLUG_00889 [Clavispora lusitaniae ATCC 42720]QFZ25802.1 putative peroxisomal membrane protein [Clavispora lusitaniae]QFZ30895.1 putative peroxisomal membrane protein [Clavispora lusitaniae]QFZ36563.1 putative peroxisomal membrane protein [Clavispora lusitaniae]